MASKCSSIESAGYLAGATIDYSDAWRVLGSASRIERGAQLRMRHLV
jgi:hypothetical protein